MPDIPLLKGPLDFGSALEAINQLILGINTQGRESATGPVKIGNYVIFVDVDGGLKIRTPDNTVIPLVMPT